MAPPAGFSFQKGEKPMAEVENLETVRRAFTALGKNDVERFIRLLSPDVEWRAPGPTDILPFAGVHKGPRAVAEWWRLLGECEEAIRFEPKEFIPYEDKVIVIGDSDMRVRKTGKELSAEWVQIYTLKDGKICAFNEFYDTAQEVEGYMAN
jgi:uncharacterized protein